MSKAELHGETAPGHLPRVGMGALALGALGVVFGDIGTSPLYAFRESFEHHDLPVTEDNALRHGVARVLGVDHRHLDQVPARS